MALQLWETMKEAIVAYTGLSPATFFTIVALSLAGYYVVSGLFASPDHHHQRARALEEEMEPLPPPVQLGEITEEELKVYDGSDSKKPLLMAIKGQIYDVSLSRMFYGPGGPYALFAGKDASRALAKMSFEEKDLTGDISGLGPVELDALQDWEYKFMSKYEKVGTIKKAVQATDEPVESTTDRDAVKLGSSTEEAAKASDCDVSTSAEDGPLETSAVEHDVAKPRSSTEEPLEATDHGVLKSSEEGPLETAIGTAETKTPSSGGGGGGFDEKE